MSERERYRELFGMYPEADPELLVEHDYNCVGCGRDVRAKETPGPSHLAFSASGRHANRSECDECYLRGEGRGTIMDAIELGGRAAGKYRKRPVVVEAIRWGGDNWSEVTEWLAEIGAEGQVEGVMVRTDTDPVQVDDRVPEFSAFLVDTEAALRIRTREGDMIARVGDWVIRGVGGELYPCKPDIFAQTYDPVLYATFNPPALTPVGWATMLLKYGAHNKDCPVAYSQDPAYRNPGDIEIRCTCGFEQVEREAHAEVGE